MSCCSTDRKGGIAELGIAFAATKLGIDVYRPMMEGGRYDLIFDLGSQLARVQCKWAVRIGEVVCVRFYSCRRTREGLARRLYTADEIDAFAAYCRELDQYYCLPFERFAGHAQAYLRLVPAANNQRIGVNWARDYELERLDLPVLGAVAQLGERLAGSQ